MRNDPSRILDALCAYWDTGVLVAAIDLGVFTALGRRALTAAELARACRTDQAALARLCRALASLGFLRARGRRYRAAADAATFLDAGSPSSIAGVRRFFAGASMTAAFAGLADTVRRGHPARRTASRASLWQEFAADAAGLRRQLGVGIADDLEARRLIRGRILDVGAGASPLGLELLRRQPAATLVVQDRPAVVGMAMRQAARAKVSRRVTARPGEALAVPWRGPYDLILMINVLDYFGPSARARLVRKARAALAPRGTLVVYAPLLDRARTSPPEAVAYDLMLLALGASGGASTFDELSALCRGAGLPAITRARRFPLVLARRGR